MARQINFLFLLIFIGGLNSNRVMAQNKDNGKVGKDVITPLDSVPKWVQEKVTSEEYNLWKTMSHIFQINYSFLNRDFPLEKRKLLYRDIREMCELINKGEYLSKKGELFSVSLAAPLDTTLSWKVCELNQIDDNIQFCKQKTIIYQNRYYKTINLECSIWYIYNSQTKKIDVIKYEISSPKSFAQFQGSASFSLRNDQISLIGNCSGSVQYYDEGHKFHSEIIYNSFIVPLHICTHEK